MTWYPSKTLMSADHFRPRQNLLAQTTHFAVRFHSVRVSAVSRAFGSALRRSWVAGDGLAHASASSARSSVMGEAYAPGLRLPVGAGFLDGTGHVDFGQTVVIEMVSYTAAELIAGARQVS